MKHNLRALKTTLCALSFLLFSLFNSTAASGFEDSLSMAGFKVDSLLASDFYAQKALCTVTQPLDWRHPELGSFTQRVLVMHRGYDRPTVVETEGYGAKYAFNPRYAEELTRFLDANLVFVEHRFFLESTPDSAHFDWKYMTAENSANDLHYVVTMMKSIYHGKWIASGISKGGQTALIYRAFFPEDVDVSVPYVAPLCRARSDGRHEPFIADSAGTAPQRARILAFQREILSRRSETQPIFDTFCMDRGYKFKMTLPEALDYTVMEFSFSFWQWGYDTEKIPSPGSSAKTLVDFLVAIDDPSYFAEGGDTAPFNYQAAHELGYYGYDLTPFKDVAVVRSTKDYYTKYMLPEGVGKVRFDKRLYKKLSKFVRTTDAKMLFVYGEDDPWTSVHVADPHHDNIKIFFVPHGSHRSRIYSMPPEMQDEAIGTLRSWLDMQD
ncbi:MAG: S28 family serine protease [Bacteroidales bacterium]